MEEQAIGGGEQVEPQSTPQPEQPAVAETPQQPTTAEAPAQPVESEQVTNEPAPEPAVEAQPQPVAQQEVVEDEPYEPQDYQYQQPYQPEQPALAPIDFSTLPRDENGDIDPNAFAQALNNQQQQAATMAAEQARLQARAEVAEQIQEEKAWRSAEEAYPELKEDKNLREMVRNQRFGEAYATGGKKFRTPKAITSEILNKFQAQKAAGIQQAQNNVVVQESATLDTASNQAGTDESTQIMQRMQSGDESANRDYLKHLIDSGKIRIE